MGDQMYRTRGERNELLSLLKEAIEPTDHLDRQLVTARGETGFERS